MSKIMLAVLALSLPLFFGPFEVSSGTSGRQRSPANQSESGTLQKMIVENGSVTMDLDLNRLNGTAVTTGKLQSVHFAVAANSFFSILVFDDLLRGPEQGSMALMPRGPAVALPVSLAASFKQLIVEKLPSDASFDLAVRDAKTGFTFFNIDGHEYHYDPDAQLFSVQGGRLVISNDFANALGQRYQAGSVIGRISIGAVM